MEYLSTIRNLLRDLKRTNRSTPSALQLQQLHVETQEDDGLPALDNAELIGEFLMRRECQTVTRVMGTWSRKCKSAPHNARDVAGQLFGWIFALSPRATVGLQIDQYEKLRITNDTYSCGVTPELTMFAYNAEHRIPFLSVIVRERNKPEPLISCAELYLMLALAETHCTLYVAEDISIRVLVVYSSWVQVMTVNTTPAYITSIVNGAKEIVDKMEIRQSRWFNFLDPAGQLQILLYSFMDVKLEPKKAGEVRMPLQPVQSTVQKLEECHRREYQWEHQRLNRQEKRRLLNEPDSDTKTQRKKCRSS